MAEIYVRTSGNDATGTGATGAPYATLTKAFSVAANGDIILMGAGTYAENGGSGYFNVNRAFNQYISIEPESGNLGDVVIAGSTGNYTLQFAASAFIQFRNLVFRSVSATASMIGRFFAANINNIRFVGCRFDVLGNPAGGTNIAFGSSWIDDLSGNPTYAISAISFIDCEVRQANGYITGGFLLDSQMGAVRDFRFVNCKVTTGSFAIRLLGMLDIKIFGCNLTSFASTVAGTCLQIGEDASVGRNTTGIVTATKCVAMTGHAAVFGAGISDWTVLDSQFYGGDNGSNGQGLVVKNAMGARFTRLTVYGGALSGLYLKACQSCLFEDVDVYNRFATAPALRVGINPELAGTKVANNTIRNCRIHAPIGQLITWDAAAGDAGGCVNDQNTYFVNGTGTWGTVRGVAITDLPSLRAAWAGYDQAYNDAGSKVGSKAVPERGNRSVALN